MSSAFRAAFGISGWLVTAALVSFYFLARYEVEVRERDHGGEALADVAAGPATPAKLETVSVAPLASARPIGEGDAGAWYQRLAAEVRNASGAERVGVDRRLEAAERKFPLDYRFSYERATLSVFGRDNHHEAFHHLRRSAEKAIGTEKAHQMLVSLEKDGGPKGPLQRLAIGHREWGALREALEHEDRHRLRPEHRIRPAVHESVRESAVLGAEHASARIEITESALGARMRALLLLKSEEPCGALDALRRVRTHPEVEELYQHIRERCLL